MKLSMLGSSACFDSDICYIRGFQRQGVELQYFFRMNGRINPLFKLQKKYPIGVIPATEIEEMQIYKNYIDLRSVFLINAPGLQFRSPRLLWLYLKVMRKIMNFNPDVVHHTWPWTRTPAITYLLLKKKSMLVHDPLPHSSHDDIIQEKYRKFGFKMADKLILLNDKTTEEFCQRYNVSSSKIAYTQLCVFDYLDYVPSIPPNETRKYLLFFGQIASYKGLDLLLEAMKQVHSVHPDWKLIVAGGGKMYFDISEYQNQDYIEFRNRFIDIPELVGLIRNCEFAVAPYRDATQSGILNNALSLNKPMIVTDVGNFTDLVHDGVTGYVVPPGNVEELTAAINKLIEHPDVRRRMSESIVTEWRDSINNDTIAVNLLKEIKMLVE